MSYRAPSDAELARALTAHLPAAAPTGLRDRVMVTVETTPQQRRLLDLVPLPSGARLAGWPRVVAVAAILAALFVATLLAAALIGSALRKDPVDPIRSSLRIPAVLHGRWEANLDLLSVLAPSGTYTVDFRSDVLVTGPSGLTGTIEPGLRDLGSAVEVTPSVGSPDVFTARIEGSCGSGLYRVVRGPEGRITFTLLTDTCALRAALLTHDSWVFGSADLEPRLGPFTPGQRYASGAFTEPFQFVVPVVDNTGENLGLREQFLHASRYVSDGGLRFGGIWWSMEILDDLPVNADLCDESSPLLPDLPATPHAMLDWFRASRLPVSDPVELPVDGRTALRFDIGEGPADCHGGRWPAGGYPAYRMRAYAIPTGHDTILLTFGSDAVNYGAVKAAVEAFVRSMDFK